MSTNELLKEVYTKFYEQKGTLEEAPQLSQDPNGETFDFEKADQELAGLVSYLMGVPDIQKETFEKIIEIIQNHYENQPEWKDLLLDYFDYTNEREKEVLEVQEAALVKEIEEFTKKLLENKE